MCIGPSAAIFRIGVAAALALTLCACGGGDGSSGDDMTPPRTGFPGRVDGTFAQGGLFVFPRSVLPNDDSRADFAMSTEGGKLLVSGTHIDRQRWWAERTGLLARLLPDGSLDPTFLGTGYLDLTGNPVHSVLANRLVPQGADTIWAQFTTLTCSRDVCPTPGPDPDHMFARRMEPTGFLTPTYGPGGTATAHFAPDELVASPDGSLVVFGRSAGPGARGTIVVQRFDPNGAPDPAFSSAATPALSCDGTDPVKAARGADGKIVAMWLRRDFDAAAADVCLARLNPDGTPDMSFGVRGAVRLSDIATLRDFSRALLVRRDGGIAAVFENIAPTGPGVPSLDRALWIAWLDDRGGLDATRGSKGITRPLDVGLTSLNAAATQPDEKIILVGRRDYRIPPANMQWMARLDSFGRIDRGFGSAGDGLVAVSTYGQNLFATHAFVAKDWSIFLTGFVGMSCYPPLPACETETMAVMKFIGGEP